MSPNFRQPEKAFEIRLTQLQAWDIIDSDSDSDIEPPAQFGPAPADSSSSEYFDSSYSDSEIEDNSGSELVESIHNLTPRTRRRFITWAGSWIANANANRIPQEG